MAGKHKNGSVNKSQAIRDFLTANPGASAQEVVDALSAKGIRIATGLVYMVKGKMGRGTGVRVKRTNAAASPVPAKPSSGSPIEYLLRVKQLAEDGGGIGVLKQFVDELAK